MKYYLGIDLGGTNVRVAKVDEDGHVYQVLKAPSCARESAKVIMDNMFSLVDQIEDLSNISGIGLCVPGPVDQTKGWMNMATNIPGLTQYPLVDEFKKRYQLPVYMDNDATVAGLAEAYLGAGRNKNIVVYVTHSTGIGAGIVINGQAVSGVHGYAGEVGNIIVNPSGVLVNHLNPGAIENEASGTALVLKAQVRIDKNINNAKQIFELVKQGHPEAIKIKDEMCHDFALALSVIAHVIDPDVFVLGGGVTLSSDVYLKDLIKVYQSMVHHQMRDVEFKLAQLDEPGIVGAAMLPKSKGN